MPPKKPKFVLQPVGVVGSGQNGGNIFGDAYRWTKGALQTVDRGLKSLPIKPSVILDAAGNFVPYAGAVGKAARLAGYGKKKKGVKRGGSSAPIRQGPGKGFNTNAPFYSVKGKGGSFTGRVI